MNFKSLFIGIAIVLLAGVAAILLRLASGPEDTWICSGGQWVRHGNPYAPMPPASECR
ncbi:MAG: hypothetical protein WCT19_01175 [Candidatus Paceibacterota bacterium]